MDLSSWWTDTVTVQSQNGSNNYGDPTYAAQRTITGRVQTQQRKVMTEKGTTVANVSVFVTDQPIATGDLLWLPGADTTKTQQARRLGSVKSGHDKDAGFTLYEVDL